MKNPSTSSVRPNTPFSAAELKTLRARYPYELTRVIAADMGRNIGSVYNRAYAMGLKKSAAFFAASASGRTNGSQGGNTRFVKGDAPWNKGTHFCAGGRSAQTRFKPGSTPPNRLPVGYIRINSDGYQDIKTEAGKNKWVALHRWNWKQEHGDYPAKGMALLFKDGDRMNCEPGNLQLISRRELMQRNTVHNLPKELALLVQLTGALNRKINDKQRQRTE